MYIFLSCGCLSVIVVLCAYIYVNGFLYVLKFTIYHNNISSALIKRPTHPPAQN